MTNVIYVKTTDEWNQLAKLHNEKNNVLVVCFGATWCGPCGALKPKFETLSTQYDDRVMFLKIDIEECEEVADKFKVSSLPTTFIIRKCEVVKSVVGADIVGIKAGVDGLL